MKNNILFLVFVIMAVALVSVTVIDFNKYSLLFVILLSLIILLYSIVFFIAINKGNVRDTYAKVDFYISISILFGLLLIGILNMCKAIDLSKEQIRIGMYCVFVIHYIKLAVMFLLKDSKS